MIVVQGRNFSVGSPTQGESPKVESIRLGFGLATGAKGK